MLSWLKRLPVPDWLKAGLIAAVLTYLVFVPFSGLINFNYSAGLWFTGLGLLAQPLLSGWLTILLFDSPFRKAFTKGFLAGLVCSLARFIPTAIFLASNPALVGDGLPMLVVTDLVLLVFVSVLSGIVTRLMASRKSSLKLVATNYAAAIESGNKSWLNWIIKQKVSCNKCGAKVIVKDAMNYPTNADLICPNCREVWAQMVVSSPGP